MVLRQIIQKKRLLPDLAAHRSRDLLGQLVKHNFHLSTVIEMNIPKEEN